MTHTPRGARQRLLALSSRQHIEARWGALGAWLGDFPTHRCVRGPETGMAMLKGRTGGTGNAFHLGEMTLTRASVALDDGTVGHGWVRGRDHRHAELIALADAVAQHAEWQEALETQLLAPLAEELAERQRRDAATAAATRVDFFTLVRGE
ncbi:MAG: phosphonate C-P lyase system protein PhnG [Salinicola sp.]|uniref:phosphonate C-P lyase system protein PhnG n=1 Tax=Salinicola sp. TaxID=1978524 RepID=UPI000C96F41E|nr:phosphonate C-P lyase system protein PhnG [Salinicola sp.]MAM58992.1 phosphonate C-P lyase system protein PhnG [Salinicola sp.]NRB54561.1 phosphonate C-P lyase system protein PhnG [Salinicola sp.]